MFKRILIGIFAGLLVVALFVVKADKSKAATSVVYDNLPSPIPSNIPSVGFQATQTAEFGSQVQLVGSERYSPTVTVLMSSWACQEGAWFSGDCVSAPDSTFDHPITLNIYNVGPSDTVGTLIVSKTETFAMPYRPSTDSINCTGGKWFDGSSCSNGKAFTIAFNLTGSILPDKVIVGIAYNTTTWGYSPIGTQPCDSTAQGCPYDSLNVGTNPAPTVGSSLPSNDDVYWNTSTAGNYSDGGTGGIGVFRMDTGWTGFLPSFKVEANPMPIIASVNGGGHLLKTDAPKRKDWLDVSFGTQVNKYLDNSLSGELSVVLHNVGDNSLDNSEFHGSQVTALNFFNGDDSSCNDAVNFTVNGTFDGNPNYSAIFRAGDKGSPNTLDTVRITIFNGLNGLGSTVYDTSGDFPAESHCVGTARTGLDTGNITIQQ